MNREVLPELLDQLPADHSDALAARADLRRINALMGNASIAAKALRRETEAPGRIGRLVELGSGDGCWMARFAQKSLLCRHPLHLFLVDQQCAPSSATLTLLARFGWTVTIVRADVFEWLNCLENFSADLVVANLFLHHFSGPRLPELLQGAAAVTNLFIAAEPRRSLSALAATRLLGCIGCRQVTRHDAWVSVKAGFRDAELSAAWPRSPGWRLREFAAGCFSHCFVAARGAGPE